MKYYREEKLDSSDLAFGDKYLKIETKSCSNKITTSFHGKAPKEGIKWVCVSAMAIDCVFKSEKILLADISRRMQTQNKIEKDKIIHQNWNKKSFWWWLIYLFIYSFIYLFAFFKVD